jgi:hypothetical protein
VPSPYTRPVIKLLFATARTCAYPGCQVPLVFEDHERGIRSVAVQIAHIRSARRSGPRHDPGYPEDRLNAEENLLLLCNPHHHPVDSNESEYTIDQLLEWKKAQVTASGGFLVGDEEVAGLAAALQVSLDEIVQSTRLQVQVRLVGGRIGWTPGVARMNLDGLGETEQTMGHLFRPGRLIGVEAENRGMVGADVQAAGIEIDHGPEQPVHGSTPSPTTASRSGDCHAGSTGTRPGSGSRPKTASAGSPTRCSSPAASARSGSAALPSWATVIGCTVTGSPGRTCRSGNQELARPSSGPGSVNRPGDPAQAAVGSQRHWTASSGTAVHAAPVRTADAA